jgi:hypothetical protein
VTLLVYSRTAKRRTGTGEIVVVVFTRGDQTPDHPMKRAWSRASRSPTTVLRSRSRPGYLALQYVASPHPSAFFLENNRRPTLQTSELRATRTRATLASRRMPLSIPQCRPRTKCRARADCHRALGSQTGSGSGGPKLMRLRVSASVIVGCSHRRVSWLSPHRGGRCPTIASACSM